MTDYNHVMYVCLSVCMSVCLSVCLYVSVLKQDLQRRHRDRLQSCDVCLSVCLSVCMSVCLYVSVLKQDLQRRHRDSLQSCDGKPHALTLEQEKCRQEMQVHYVLHNTSLHVCIDVCRSIRG